MMNKMNGPNTPLRLIQAPQPASRQVVVSTKSLKPPKPRRQTDQQLKQHHPSPILLAAQERAEQIRRQDAQLKREIEWLARLTQLSYEQARQYVLRDKGLLR
jgi:hypothetical protein